MADVPPYPLYNRTYHLYRLSPLHHGNTPVLDERILKTHAIRLKGQLKGDNIRGVDVDGTAPGGAIAQYGPLEECHWSLIGDEDAWIDHHQQQLDPDSSQLSSGTTAEHARGIQITLVYESQTYTTLLLRDPSIKGKTSLEAFTYLPLMLIKMPAPIRDIFLTYIKTAFDTQASPLKLRPSCLTSALETYIRRLVASTSTQSIRDIIQQLHIQLAFPGATSLLRHIDITIASSDVAGFVSRGSHMRHANSNSAPFTTALSTYLQKHMAICLSNSQVHVSKIFCGAFSLSTDRLKLIPPEIMSDISMSEGNDIEASASQLATEDIYSLLVREASSDSKFLPQALLTGRDSSTPSSTGSGSASRGRRKRAISTTAATNTITKRSRPPGKTNSVGAENESDMDTSSA